MVKPLRQIFLPLVARFHELMDQAGAAIEPYTTKLSARYQKFEPRERLLLQVAAGLVGALLLYDVGYLPVQALGHRLANRLAQRRQELSEVRRLTYTYTAMERTLAAARKKTVPKAQDFSLFSVLEQSLTRSIGRDKIGSITPAADQPLAGGFTRYRVDVALNNVNLAQIVDALYGVEALPLPLTVTSIHIKRRAQDSHSYDVTMSCGALGKTR